MSNIKPSVKIAAALLATTAFTVPAMAQIETVVVTAERKAEDIQTTPISITALTGSDLKAKQVNSTRDLQFHVPSVTYTKSNFGNAQFQIRGITTQFGLGAAIAQNENDIYMEAPALVSGEYFDVARVEVARGPQSTSYGRAATGGAVNIITNKADVNAFAASASFDYGTYNTFKPEFMVNVPLIEGELALRVAGQGLWHDGYEKNVYSGTALFPGGPVDKRVNGQGTMQGRVSLRWEPSDDTSIDLVADVGTENDTRVRGDKQMCHRDPSGVLGCLPDQLGFDPINTNSTVAVTLASKQGIAALLNTSFGVPFPTAFGLGQALGIYNIGGNGLPFNVAPAPVNGPGSNANGFVPADLLTVNTAFNPKSKGMNGVYTLNWSQTITPWLKSTVDVGYVSGNLFSQQAYNDGAPENISALIAPAVGAFNAVLGPFATAYSNAYFDHAGQLPLSSLNYNGTYGSYGGIIDNTRGGVLTKTPYALAYDEENFGQHEWTGEMRFQTGFEGPLNFSAGAFWMSYSARSQYRVASSVLDYDAIAAGAAARFLTFTQTGTDIGPMVAALPTFDSEYRRNDIQSRSGFVEGTYDILPDTLKVILGVRYNDDRESLMRTDPVVGGGLLTTGFAPIGSTGVILPVDQRSPTLVNGQQNTVTDKWTGRATVNWTPKLSWTDQTLVYATLSRGELAGGINVSNSGLTTAVAPPIFQPATVDAAELGTKNMLLDGTLQANLDVWYYNYENYQVGIIANRQSLTLNIPAHLYGAEGELVWQPEEDLQFNMSLSLTRSQAGTSYIVDQRNPTAGVPNSILVKDLVNGSNCVIVPTSGATAGHTPGESSAFHVSNFYLPNGGNPAVDAPYGVPLVNYGLCQPGTAVEAQLKAAGFDYSEAVNPATGAPTGVHDGNGNAVNLKGNALPNVPNAQLGMGVQWTAHLGGEYTLVPRVDYYWQSGMWSRVWNDANIDRIGAWDTMNAQIQLNAPEDAWYARVFATNVFDKRNPTGQYLTDPTSALFTNVFVEDPRVVGVSLGASW